MTVKILFYLLIAVSDGYKNGGDHTIIQEFRFGEVAQMQAACEATKKHAEALAENGKYKFQVKYSCLPIYR